MAFCTLRGAGCLSDGATVTENIKKANIKTNSYSGTNLLGNVPALAANGLSAGGATHNATNATFDTSRGPSTSKSLVFGDLNSSSNKQ